MPTALELLEVAKRYPGSQALRGVSLEIERGELFGLVGPDGAGKTTLLRILAGVLRPTGGRVQIDGLDAVRERDAVRRKVGYMSQRFSLSENLTVAENLLYVCEVWHVPRGERRTRVERLLAFSRLGPFQDRLARNLSGGMKQKLALSACLVHRPRILLLDEPTIGVDPLSRRDFWLILYELLQEGTTILLSTPYMDEAERCGRVGFLLAGQLLACGRPEELKARLGVAMLDLVCERPREALRRLRAAGLREATSFGEHVHVAVPEGTAPETEVARLRAAGVAVQSWALARPSLEDVFLSISRGAHDG